MWKIETQVEKRGRAEFNVLCKHVRFFPIEGGDTIEFGRLTFLNLRVIISHEKHGTLVLSASVKEGTPSFTVKHPEVVAFKKLWIGEGKNRRQIEDTLSPAVLTAGPKEKYEMTGFESRLRQLGGEELAGKVMTAFAARFAEFAVKAKRAA